MYIQLIAMKLYVGDYMIVWNNPELLFLANFIYLSPLYIGLVHYVISGA
jgi:hypothetical protein